MRNACNAFQNFDRNDPAWDAWLENMVSEIEKMQSLVSEVRHGLDQLGGALRLREKMGHLREGTAGRTDAEIETAHRSPTDRLEARGLAAMSGGGNGWRRPLVVLRRLDHVFERR
jgi:hypothetical protein